MKIFRYALPLVPIAALGACSDASSPTGGPLAVNLQFSAVTDLAAVSAPITLNDGTNELVISQVELVVEAVEFEGAENVCATVGDDDCGEFETGPALIDLPLDATAQSLTVPVPPGTYDEVEIEIEVVEGDEDEPEEQAFLDANPDFVGISLRVVGTFNGESYTFVSGLEVEQEVEFPAPIVLTETSPPVDVDIMVDVSGWFVNKDGQLIDPRTALSLGPNQIIVERNIRDSFDTDDDEEDDDDG